MGFTIRFVALLWALPTSQTNLAVVSDWEFSHSVSSCKLKDCHFKVQNRTSEAKVIRGQTEDSVSLYRDPANCVNY